MTSLAPHTLPPRSARRRGLRSLFLALAIVASLPRLTRAQVGLTVNLTHTEDAAPVPQGMLRFKMTTGWSRFDERFTTSGRSALGADFSTDSLGPRQLPGLGTVEQGLQTLTNDPQTRLTLGRLAVSSGGRIVTTPIAFEYGLTRRLSVGILIPLVQTRQAISLKVNADSSNNVDFVSTRQRQAAATANAGVYSAFKSAADSLQRLITGCPTNPLAAGCAAVNANPSDANSARAQAQAFANAIQSALGIADSVALIAPRDHSPLALAIDAQRNAINAQIRKYLGAGAGATGGIFTSTSNFSYIDLQGRNGTPGLLQSPLGGGLDSIRTVNRLEVGGISIGASYLLFDRFRHDTASGAGLQTRMIVGGSFRFASTLFDSSRKIVGYQAGEGAGVEVRSALDLARRSLGATIAARYVQSFSRNIVAPLFGDPEAAYPIPVYGNVSRTAGAVMSLDLTPRYLANDYFSIDGHYGFERSGSATYDRGTTGPPCLACAGTVSGTFTTPSRVAQRIGLGVRYSTVEAYTRGRTGFPAEISFTHLETITGDAGTPKIFRDQVQMRLFFRILGGR